MKSLLNKQFIAGICANAIGLYLVINNDVRGTIFITIGTGILLWKMKK